MKSRTISFVTVFAAALLFAGMFSASSAYACCGGDGPGPDGSHGRDQAIPVPVTPRPVCTLVVTPEKIEKGESVKLKWTTNNAYLVKINQGVGGVALNGSKTVNNVTTSRTYTLTATGRGGTVTCSDTVVVKQKPYCEIWADPDLVKKGGSSTLSWTSQNATSAYLDKGIGSVAVNGSKKVYNIQYYTTYTLTVNGPDGTATCSTMVDVKKEPPPHESKPTCWIKADKPYCSANESVTLTWGSQNATGAWLDPVDESIPTSGSKTVWPGSTGTYTMWVWDNSGKVGRCDVEVMVDGGHGGEEEGGGEGSY